MSELEPRLRSLERQSKRASEYLTAQADLTIIRRDWNGYHWHKVQQELTDTREVVKAQELRLQEARKAHAVAQTDYNAFRERLSGLRTQLNAWHRQSSELHNQREEVSRELAVLEERRRALLSSQTSALTDQERASDEERVSRERLAEVEQEVARLRSEHDEAKKQFQEVQQSLQNKQAERASLEGNLQTARGQIEKWSTQRAESQARLDELKSRLESLNTKMEAAQKVIEVTETVARESDEKLSRSRVVREDAENALRQTEENEENHKKEFERLENGRRTQNDIRAELLSKHTRIKTQLEVLEQSEQSLAGYAEGARFLLEAAQQMRLKGARGALSAALDVPAEFEMAIAAALGDTLDAVMLDASEIEDALQLLESDEAGRAVLLPLNDHARQTLSRPNDENCLGVASELVNAPDDLRAAVNLMLGQTLVVRDRSSARQMIRDLPTHARIVTLRGEVFRGDGLIVAGKSASSSALSRPRQKRELTEALSALSVQIDAVNREVESLSSQINNVQSKLAEAGSAVREARARLEDAEESEKQAGLESEAKHRELEWQKSQQVQLKVDADEAESTQRNLIEIQTTVDAESAKAQDELRAMSAQLNETDFDEAQTQASYWSTRVAVAEKALEDARLRMDERAKEAEKFDTRQNELTTRLSEAETSLSSLDADKAALYERESELRSQIETLHVDVDPAERELESAEVEETRLQDLEANAQRALATGERLHGQVQLEQLRKQEALDNLRLRITDDFGLVMFDYADEVAGPVPLPLDGMVEELPVVTEISPDLETQLTRQRTQVRRMGPINPEAKQEFDQESERYSFMSTQVDDLRKAEEDLRQVIAELDELTRQEFSKTFDAVDKQFREMFTRLFAGGSARLALTDPDNLVETGLEIEARLPGRREQGLALLSGGERSLTAVARVFALL
jgi:chromosome segregation protein